MLWSTSLSLILDIAVFILQARTARADEILVAISRSCDYALSSPETVTDGLGIVGRGGGARRACFGCHCRMFGVVKGAYMAGLCCDCYSLSYEMVVAEW